MNWLDTKYASLITPYVRNFRVKGTSLWNFSCPICGDSQSRKHLARGYLYEDDHELKYKCHNCGFNSKFWFFLKTLNAGLYKQYKLEKMKTEGKMPKKAEVKYVKPEMPVKSDIEKQFLPLNDAALAYLKSREITKIDDIKYTDDLFKLTKFFPDKSLPEGERIIFPIRNRRKELVGISARSINPANKLRYVLLKILNEPLIFGLDKVDISKDVYVLEGAIDSLHLDNAIAVNGSDLIKVSEIIPKDRQILVFDNQPRNREIVNKMLAACDNGYRIVIWPKNIPEKDVNLMVRTYGLAKVIEWLGNTYKGMSCKVKINDWKRI